MASIQKRGKKYAVVYTYTDSADVKRQKWETYGTKKEAAARKAQVENEMNNGTFIPPSSVTVRDFLADFVELYGSKRWGLSAYSGNTGIINNYINPVIGDMNVQDVTRRTVDSFIAQLQKMKPVSTTYRNARSEFLPPNTIEKVCKVLHCAFRQAVRWDMVPKNPFDDVLLPKKEKNPRAIWTADIIRQALDNCSEGKLYVAINLSFACSLRMGEITGLTWDCVHISDSDIAKDDAHIIVNKELARVDQRAIDALGEKDIIFMFPRIVKAKSTTRLVLKRPKTETSIRKVWLPKTLAYILRDWHQKQDKLKEIMGDEYADYNLVLALETGRPCEDRVIGNQFERLKKSANLPNVVFHSLRHSSTTYKLKLNHGDIKATQGDTGHAQASREVAALLTEMGFLPHSVRRGGSSVIYFKQSEHIEDLLTTIGAPAAAMDIMTAKVDKEIRNGANRAMNCDMANVNKTIDAALEQKNAIQRLQENGRLERLPEKLRQTALLRLQYPEMSLSQLAEKCDPPVTKSCMNHRMRKLLEEAKKL